MMIILTYTDNEVVYPGYPDSKGASRGERYETAANRRDSLRSLREKGYDDQQLTAHGSRSAQPPTHRSGDQEGFDRQKQLNLNLPCPPERSGGGNLFLPLVLLVLLPLFGESQDSIHLQNPSFEGKAALAVVPAEWMYQGFAGETPPDLLPYRGNYSYVTMSDGGVTKVHSTEWGFGVSLRPIHGNTYLGMVTRDNETWESLAQELTSPLSPDTCYAFSLHLASSAQYHSLSRSSGNPQNYNHPTRLVMHSVDQRGTLLELLGATPPVDHPVWRPYTLILRPERTVRTLKLSAWYAADSITAGNILIDAIRPLVPCPCFATDLLPAIDTLTFDIPPRPVQARQLVHKLTRRITFGPEGQPPPTDLFRHPAFPRAIYQNEVWFMLELLLRQEPQTIAIAIRAEHNKTYRQIKRWVAGKLHALPDLTVASITRYRPEKRAVWPQAPSERGLTIRFR